METNNVSIYITSNVQTIDRLEIPLTFLHMFILF